MATKTRTVSADVDVEIDLEDFSDQEIEEEYKARCLSFDEDEQIYAIYVAMRQNAEAKAYELMRQFVLDKLGKVV